jgi:SAM-dependent methyltransferase
VRNPEELFAGAARYYARFRAPYPDGVFALLRREFRLDGTGTLLDLGCGTGQVALRLARDFARVVAVDVDTGMLEEGRRAAVAADVKNVEWIRGTAEEMVPDRGPARLATCGNAFHWMDRERVLAGLDSAVEPEGGLAILAGGSISLWNTEATWARAAIDVIRRHLGGRRRAGKAVFEEPEERHEEVCRRSAFSRVKVHRIPVERRWTVDEFVGALYSTSYCSPVVLGDRRAAFEADLRATLAQVVPEEEPIVNRLEVDVIFARR